jgi:hypothetical protein
LIGEVWTHDSWDLTKLGNSLPCEEGFDEAYCEENQGGPQDDSLSTRSRALFLVSLHSFGDGNSCLVEARWLRFDVAASVMYLFFFSGPPAGVSLEWYVTCADIWSFD